MSDRTDAVEIVRMKRPFGGYCQCVCVVNHPHRVPACAHVPESDGICQPCRAWTEATS